LTRILGYLYQIKGKKESKGYQYEITKGNENTKIYENFFSITTVSVSFRPPAIDWHCRAGIFVNSYVRILVSEYFRNL